MAKEWDKVNMKRETAEAFQQYAKSLSTTVGTYLRGEAPSAGCTAFYTMVGGTPK